MCNETKRRDGIGVGDEAWGGSGIGGLDSHGSGGVILRQDARAPSGSERVRYGVGWVMELEAHGMHT